MKTRILSICSFVFMLSMVSCGGNSSDKQRIADLESKIQELQNKLNDTSKVQEVNEKENISSSESEAVTEETSSSYDSYTPTKSSGYESSKNNNYFAGTYEVTDAVGDTYTIELNSDETVKFMNSRGGVKYGSWRDSPYGVPKLSFSYSESPVIFFPGGESDLDFAIISDGYLYSSNVEYKSKNPRKRLDIKKIK